MAQSTCEIAIAPSRPLHVAIILDGNGLQLANRLEQKRVARDCAEWMRQKVDIRSVRHAQLLHGKMYHIANAGVEEAILGSSNFTVRGLGLAVCWSPFFVASAIAGQLVPGVRAWQTIVIGLALAMIGRAVSHLMFFRGADLGGGFRGIRPLLAPIGLCVALVALVSAATRMSGLEAIVVLMPLLCGAYLAIQGAQAAADTFGRVFAGLGGLADEIIIMSVALVLGTAVKGLVLDGALASRPAGWPICRSC